MRSRVLLVFCLITLPLCAGEVEFRPAPRWVERLTVDAHPEVSRKNVRWGIYDILDDHQVRVGGHEEQQYFRTVREVLSPGGVQNASELTLDFDPSFERLTIHEIAIIRGGKRIDALDPDSVRVIDKEDDADDRIFDGEQSALVFIEDVRPGDVIDYSWSLTGANPILGGKYTDEYDLSSSVPSRRMRHRLLWPAGRPLQWRGAEPTIGARGDERTFVWELQDVPAITVEDDIPSWFEPWKSVQVTELASWHEVAGWASAMFRLDARSRADVARLADTFRRENPSRDGQITAAIRFVQDEVRYLGIEMGRNSHEPHQPWETLQTRWGDCKDKTLLLVSLLRELGLEAYPALVNTSLRHRLEEKLPSPFLFDHVITEVVDGNKTYWIDGTIAEQGGTLATIETPNDERALVVRPETTTLASVETRMKGATRVDQTYTVTDYSQPTALRVRTTYTGSDADEMRATIAALSIEDLAHERINDLAVDQPSIQAVGLPEIKDDRTRDFIVITANYRIPGLWRSGHLTWYPRVLESFLDRPETMIRTMPLAFDYPLNVRQSVVFNFPESVEVAQSTSVTETPTFRYEYSVDWSGKSVTVRQSLRSRQDFVPVANVGDHLTKLAAIWSEIGYRLSPGGAAPKPVEETPDAVKWALGILLAATLAAVTWMLAMRVARRAPIAALGEGYVHAGVSDAAPIRPPTRRSFLPGEAPASALSIRGPEDIDQHLAAIACACGARIQSPAEIQRARYAEREMTIVVRRCAMCGREQSIYFTTGA